MGKLVSSAFRGWMEQRLNNSYVVTRWEDNSTSVAIVLFYEEVSLACSYVVLIIQRAWGTAGM